MAFHKQPNQDEYRSNLERVQAHIDEARQRQLEEEQELELALQVSHRNEADEEQERNVLELSLQESRLGFAGKQDSAERCIEEVKRLGAQTILHQQIDEYAEADFAAALANNEQLIVHALDEHLHSSVVNLLLLRNTLLYQGLLGYQLNTLKQVSILSSVLPSSEASSIEPPI